jgi:hypothetical protein
MNRQFESEPTFWTWGGDRPAPGSSVDLGAADDLAVGGVRWHAGHQLYLVRTDEAVMAFSQRFAAAGMPVGARHRLRIFRYLPA